MTITNTGGVLPDSEHDSQKVGYYNTYATTILEPLIIGELSLSVAGSSNVTLTDTQGRNKRMVFTGALTGDIIVYLRVPTGTPAGYAARQPSVTNNTTGAFKLTVKTTAAGSTGIEVKQGTRQLLEHDGTNVYPIGAPTTSTGLSVPRALVYNSTAQSIPNNTVTIMNFNSETYDTDSIHDNATNNTRLTCKTAGDYSIGADIIWATNGVGNRLLQALLNGTTVIWDTGIVNLGAGYQSRQGFLTLPRTLAVNDYVELRVYQDSGGALSIDIGLILPTFGMFRIG